MILFPGSVTGDEVDDRRTVIETMRMVPDAGLPDEGDGAAESLVFFLHDSGVFVPGNDIVSITENVEQRNLVLGKGSQFVDGVPFVGQGFGFILEGPEF